MVRTAFAAVDPDDPEHSNQAQRPHLEVVPGVSEADAQLDPGPPPSFGENPLAEADIARLPSSARHRIAAFIHLQLAALEEMPEPLPDWKPSTDEL
ncbi:hypothetical protein [Nocardia crassostreae]|uniref:hypothetical protein n=1 Tax=Nocardia crassostreae TaxID=53428 RepID=UPI00082CEA5C|nr:hypothetical protein [Nocardia crassostreae]